MGWVIVFVNILFSGVILLDDVGAQTKQPLRIGPTGGTILPETFLPMKRRKPPTLPCISSNQLLEGGDEFFIESPEFSKQSYPNSAYCEWKLAANHCSMGINCPDFKLTDFLCFDHLDIVDQNGTLSRYCGTKGPKETVLADNVTISFRSSPWFSNLGFRCRVVCRVPKTEDDDSPFTKPSAEPSNCHCGKGDQRVTGGTPTRISRFPWQAGLVRKGEHIPFCGGSLINSNYILTAAHFKRTPYNLEIIFNVTNVGAEGDQGMEVRRSVENILAHKKYSSILEYDAALIKLSEPIDISASLIVPVCLPELGKTYVGNNATITGWGQTSETGSLSPILQEAEVEVISNEECTKYYPYITDKMLCAHTPGKDACQGDSGGPLVVPEGEMKDHVPFIEDPANPEKPSHFVQVGIVSWGQGCGVKPGVYTRVSELLKWIEINARDGSYCSND